MLGQLLPSLHQHSHCQSLPDGSRQDEHGDIIFDQGARGNEIRDVAWHQQGRNWSCTHSQLDAKRSFLENCTVIVTPVVIVFGVAAPCDGTLASFAIFRADDKLSAIALARYAVPVDTAVSTATTLDPRPVASLLSGRETRLEPWLCIVGGDP